MFSSVLLITSCSKNENPISDGNVGSRLRISRSADNIGMQNAINFEYNSKNLLVKIWQDRDYISFESMIEYNSSNKPIKATNNQYYSGRIEEAKLINIQWTNDGFNMQWLDLTYDNQYLIKFDSQGKILSKTYIQKHLSSAQSEITTFEWIGENNITEKLKEGTYPAMTTANYILNTIKNPFDQINIAILLIGHNDQNLSEFQNKYCISQKKDTNVLSQCPIKQMIKIIQYLQI